MRRAEWTSRVGATETRRRGVAVLWLYVLLSACSGKSVEYPTTWLEIETRHPYIDIPHVLRIGRDTSATIRRKYREQWQEVDTGGGVTIVTVLSSGAVLLSQPSRFVRIVRADQESAVSLPTDLCSSPVVSPGGDEIICAACVDPGPGFVRCARVEVAAYDARGVMTARLLQELPVERECGVGPITKVLFGDQGEKVLAIECRDDCRLFSLFDLRQISERPGICSFQPSELNRMHLWTGMAPYQ